MKIAIVIPVYNEGKRAVNTVKEILKVDRSSLIILVDDGSNDNSNELLSENFNKNSRILILSHSTNLGKGSAMKTGVERAFKLGCDSVIFLDSDGQHNAKHLIDFKKELQKSNLVFGYRKMGIEMPILRRFGNIMVVKLVKTLFNIQRSDILCGYFGFNKSVYELIKWDESRYGVETEIAVRVAKNNLSFKEIKVDTIYIDKYKGLGIFEALGFLIKIPFWYFTK